MEPDVAGGGGGEPGGLEPRRLKRAGSGRTPAPAPTRGPPGAGAALGRETCVGGNRRLGASGISLQASLLALPLDPCVITVFELFVGACCPSWHLGAVYIFHSRPSRTACGMWQPRCLKGALWGNFVPPGCSDNLGGVCVCGDGVWVALTKLAPLQSRQNLRPKRAAKDAKIQPTKQKN